MRIRSYIPGVALVASCAIAALPATAQQPTEVSTSQTPLIKTQTRLVLVDTVVTDKKGNPVRDLTAKDFKVFEDNKEQQIASFSAGTVRNPGLTVCSLPAPGVTGDSTSASRARSETPARKLSRIR